MNSLSFPVCACCGQSIIPKSLSIAQILGECGMLHVLPDTRLDFKTMTAIRKGKPVKLTKTMWRLMAILIAAGGDLVTRSDLNLLCFDSIAMNIRSLDTFIAMIRKSIGNVIKTEHGLGYSWCPDGFIVKYTRHSRAPKKQKKK